MDIQSSQTHQKESFAMSNSQHLEEGKKALELAEKISKVSANRYSEMVKLDQIKKEYSDLKTSLIEKNSVAWDRLSIIAKKWLETLTISCKNHETLTLDTSSFSPDFYKSVYIENIAELPAAEESINRINHELYLLQARSREIFSKKIALLTEIFQNRIEELKPSDENISNEAFLNHRKQMFDQIHNGILIYKVQAVDPNFNIENWSFPPSIIDNTISWASYINPISYITTPATKTGFEDNPTFVFHSLILAYFEASKRADSCYALFKEASKKLFDQLAILNTLNIEWNELRADQADIEKNKT